ncbi:MAG: sensor histidine kinase [Alphaproteobacteria bacterium]|nr:sensor histidine kinase [Alphaproteobacteria bacterium]
MKKKLRLFHFWSFRRKVAEQAWPHVLWVRERTRTHFSPLTLRILIVPLIAPAVLVGSFLYMGQYKNRLIEAELNSLLMQTRMSASALAEGAVVLDEDESNILSPLLARLMVRRLVEASETRTRLFDINDQLVADSRILLEVMNKPQELPPVENIWHDFGVRAFYDRLDRLAQKREYPLYPGSQIERGHAYDIIRQAREEGRPKTQVWRLPEGGYFLVAVAPVQRYRQVLGTVMLTQSDEKIMRAIQIVRDDTLKLFGIALFVTVLLALYLAQAIVRPLKLLSKAVESIRKGQVQLQGLEGSARALKRSVIPDFSKRQDEIGDLSVAVNEMTSAIARRISAIENFAADVAHEIKNPLTSLRSAVETSTKIKDQNRLSALMAVIKDDVDRLDRLITDISRASRLDGELSRDEMTVIDIYQMLTTFIGFYSQYTELAPVVLELDRAENLKISGVEARLIQVMQNLIDNAQSFAPAGTKVVIRARRATENVIEIIVEDEGPGIPQAKIEAIFDRFYSERPKTEKFGLHSGLGLSISKQIVAAHHGKIWAENRKNEKGLVFGARFVMQLPARDES